MKKVWQDNLHSEVAYWRSVLDGSHHNKNWVRHYRERIGGEDIAYPRLHKYFAGNPKILDVGAGPLSGLGAIHQKQPLDIVAIDPLAREYEKIFEDLSITPAVKTQYGIAEDLSMFAPGTFDFVYSCNALDHSWDPVLAIRNMCLVCKPGGAIRLETYTNEGLHASYWGLHQWNFMKAGSSNAVIWNRTNQAFLLAEELGPYRFQSMSVEALPDRWLFIEIKR